VKEHKQSPKLDRIKVRIMRRCGHRSSVARDRNARLERVRRCARSGS
jgi:hypothetical protein